MKYLSSIYKYSLNIFLKVLNETMPALPVGTRTLY